MTDIAITIIGIAGAIAFVFLLADKHARKISCRESVAEDHDTDDPESLSNEYFYDRWK